MTTRGVLYVHSAPPALCPHVEWAATGVLGVRVCLQWTPQPAAPGTVRAELSWQGKPGSAAALTSALRKWQLLRFEVTEEPGPGADGERYAFTPTLGLFAAVIGVHGDILVSEHRLQAVLQAAAAGQVSLPEQVRHLIGTPWDDELERFRHAGEDSSVRWLHRVG